MSERPDVKDRQLFRYFTWWTWQAAHCHTANGSRIHQLAYCLTLCTKARNLMLLQAS